MSGASWKHDPTLIRPGHKWKYSGVSEYDWGVSVTFFCDNLGCPTTISRPLRTDDGTGSGICFNQDEAVQLTDRDGNEIQHPEKGHAKDE